jgi:hypothetical protein
MSHPWVYSATIADGRISFRVEVTDVMATQRAIEITGEATQVNGALAPISCVTDITAAYAGDPNDPEEAGRYFVDVDALPTPDHSFNPDEDLTAFVRVCLAWATVLGPGSGDPAQSRNPGDPPGPTWGNHKADSHVSATGSY